VCAGASQRRLGPGKKQVCSSAQSALTGNVRRACIGDGVEGACISSVCVLALSAAGSRRRVITGPPYQLVLVERRSRY
jgi:hypothetical protein